MTFDEMLTQIVELLQREGRVTYRALKRRFALDDDYLEDLKGEIIKAKRLAVDEDGEVLVWRGERDKRGKRRKGETKLRKGKRRPRTPTTPNSELIRRRTPAAHRDVL